MKDYYQAKGIWRMDDNVFKQTFYFIRQYPKWQEMTDISNNTSKLIKDVEKTAVIAADAETNIEVVNKAMVNYVPAEFQNAVFAHIVDGLNYNDIEAKFGVTQEDIKEYRARLIWAVASEMGWIYTT